MQLIFFFALVCLHFCFFVQFFVYSNFSGKGVWLTYVKTHFFSCISECCSLPEFEAMLFEDSIFLL